MKTAPFCLVKEPTAWWPVKFAVPADGGRVVEQQVEVKFARLSRADFTSCFVQAADQEPNGAATDLNVAADNGASARKRAEDDNRRLFERVVKDWRGIADDQGAAVPFKDPWIAMFLDVPGVPEAFGRAYAAFWAAQPEAVLGNSGGSPGGGAETAALQPDRPDATTSQRPSKAGARRQQK